MSAPKRDRLYCRIFLGSGRLWALLLLVCLALLPACSFNGAISPTSAPTALGQPCSTPGPDSQAEDCLPGDVNGTLVATPSAMGTLRMPVPSPIPTNLPAATRTYLSPTPCTAEQCVYSTSLLLARPVAPPHDDQVDVTYRFGSTQDRRRDPHHGVEFLNGSGTPVLAAGDGVVVVAGDDKETLYSPYTNFYGNLVVIKHDLPPGALQGLPGFPTPVYTLYAHLSELLVKAGQVVRAGQEIGRVGMSGGATGSHLHFEVRLGENSYKASRNPELWLKPHADADGRPNGALAGRFLDAYGNSLEMPSIVLQHLPGDPDGASDFQVTLTTYEEKGLVGQEPFQESFGIGDLLPGVYRVSFPMGGLRSELVQVYPGQLTVITFREN